MTEPRNHWSKRTFDYGSKRRALTTADGTQPLPVPPAAANAHNHEEARLAGYAEALTACAALARTWEAKGANAGVLRIQLEQRADEAWNRLDAHHHHPLGAEAAQSGMIRGSTASAPSGDQEPPPSSPLDLQRRLDLVTESLGRAIATLDEPAARRLLGGAGRAMIEYLRIIRGITSGERVPVDSAPEPESLRAEDGPGLRLVSDPATSNGA